MTGVETFVDLDLFRKVIHRSVERSRYTTMAVIPEGPYVVPIFQEE